MSTLKVYFGADVRRFKLPLNVEDPFTFVIQQISTAFKIPSESRITLKYEDEENDMISLSSSAELVEALRIASAANHHLKIFASSSDPSPILTRPISVSSDTALSDASLVNLELEQTLSSPVPTSHSAFQEVPSITQVEQTPEMKDSSNRAETPGSIMPVMEKSAPTCPYVRRMNSEHPQPSRNECPYMNRVRAEVSELLAETRLPGEGLDKLSGKPLHVDIRCDGCHMFPVVGVRYKCTKCPNYDLCEQCEAKNTHPRDHILLKINIAKLLGVVHEHIVCNGCHATPIVGIRFQCSICPDFDLCEHCKAKNTHPTNHPLLKLREPVPPCVSNAAAPALPSRRCPFPKSAESGSADSTSKPATIPLAKLTPSLPAASAPVSLPGSLPVAQSSPFVIPSAPAVPESAPPRPAPTEQATIRPLAPLAPALPRVPVSFLYTVELQQLQAMGFTDAPKCIRVLSEVKGNLEHAVHRLL